MAKAQYHKHQRVYVRPVGTWALIERVVPQWTKGLEEPIRIFYDVGLGREFAAEELQSEMTSAQAVEGDSESWRIVRARNKWQSELESATHPYPGTYPVIVTGDTDWGGWRVPGSEYALSPGRIERQARVMACAPRMASIVTKLAEWAKRSPNDVPEALLELMRQSREIAANLDDGTE